MIPVNKKWMFVLILTISLTYILGNAFDRTLEKYLPFIYGSPELILFIFFALLLLFGKRIMRFINL